jgi:phage terminase Nu1 subunit (DNA packaging protein)
MASVDLVSPAEYARRRGVSRAAVSQAIKQGRISLLDGKIDPAVADIQWERNTRRAVGRGGHAATDQLAQRDGAAHSADAAPDRAAHSPSTPPKPAHDYESARAKREYHEAQLSELKALERLGQLVEAARVKLAMADIARVMLDGLERIPDRVSVQIHAGMTQAEIHAQLERELATVREDIRAAIADLPNRLHPNGSP